jgi:hypothetical protein
MLTDAQGKTYRFQLGLLDPQCHLKVIAAAEPDAHVSTRLQDPLQDPFWPGVVSMKECSIEPSKVQQQHQPRVLSPAPRQATQARAPLLVLRGGY